MEPILEEEEVDAATKRSSTSEQKKKAAAATAKEVRKGSTGSDTEMMVEGVDADVFDSLLRMDTTTKEEQQEEEYGSSDSQSDEGTMALSRRTKKRLTTACNTAHARHKKNFIDFFQLLHLNDKHHHQTGGGGLNNVDDDVETPMTKTPAAVPDKFIRFLSLCWTNLHVKTITKQYTMLVIPPSLSHLPWECLPIYQRAPLVYLIPCFHLFEHLMERIKNINWCMNLADVTLPMTILEPRSLLEMYAGGEKIKRPSSGTFNFLLACVRPKPSVPKECVPVMQQQGRES
uniref:DDE-1 domain-containing protein n=1 Tax=Globodera pallida TaxID=36090 RepID=A0A183CN77_GLOPA